MRPITASKWVGSIGKCNFALVWGWREGEVPIRRMVMLPEVKEQGRNWTDTSDIVTVLITWQGNPCLVLLFVSGACC